MQQRRHAILEFVERQIGGGGARDPDEINVTHDAGRTAINFAHAAPKLVADHGASDALGREERDFRSIGRVGGIARQDAERHPAIGDAAAALACGGEDGAAPDEARAGQFLGSGAQEAELRLGVARELAGRVLAGQANAALGATAREDGATGLGARAGEKTKLAHTALLRGLESTFHGRSEVEG